MRGVGKSVSASGIMALHTWFELMILGGTCSVRARLSIAIA
jgi:hypothetical protein